MSCAGKCTETRSWLRKKQGEKTVQQGGRKTNACLSFGDKLLLRAGVHEKNNSQAWLPRQFVSVGKATQPGGRHSQVLGQHNPVLLHWSQHLRITCGLAPDTLHPTILMSCVGHQEASKYHEHLERAGPDIAHTQAIPLILKSKPLSKKQ